MANETEINQLTSEVAGLKTAAQAIIDNAGGAAATNAAAAAQAKTDAETAAAQAESLVETIAPLATLETLAAQTAADAANSALNKTASETARDAAFANASVYADVATGRAAVADGGQFMVVSGSEIIRYRRDSSTTQTQLASYPSTAKISRSLDDLNTEALIQFADAGGRDLGHVDSNGAWGITLQSLMLADGTTFDDMAINGATAAFVVVDADNRVIFDSRSVDSALVDEVSAARGSTTSLNDRLSSVVDVNGAPTTAVINREALRVAHRKLLSLEFGEAAQLNIAFVGDSYTQSAGRYSGTIATLMAAQFGDGGGGWTGYGFFVPNTPPYVIGGSQPSGVNGNARPHLYDLDFKGSWVASYNNSVSPDLAHITSSTAGDLIRRTVPTTPDHTALRVLFIGTSNGVVRSRVDGGSWSSHDTQGTVGAIGTFDVALTSGAHTVEVEVVSGTVSLCGDIALSSASGVRVHKLGGSGANVSNWWTPDTTQRIAGWSLLDVDTFVWMEAPNSQGAGISPTTWIDRWDDLMDRMRAAAPGCDIGIISGPELPLRDAPAYTLIAEYASTARAYAFTNSLPHLNLQHAFGPDKTVYASTGTAPLFNADGIHPEPATGGRLMASEIMNLFR